MTHEEIIAMAREAGFEVHERKQQVRVGADALLGIDSSDKLERFAALVAEKAEAKANDRANTSWKLMCEKMVAAEREACAQVCEANRTNPPQGKPDDVERGFNAAIRRCAAAIRARGQKEGA